jgi:hypothetical protein
MTTPASQLRAAGRESVLVEGCVRLIGAARHAAANMSARPAISRATGDDESISESVGNSRAVRTVLAIADSLERAWQDSTARAAIQPLARGLHALTGEQRIRVAGTWIAVAAITDGLLALVDPRPASLVRWSLWAAALLVGAAAALAAAPLYAAWFEWRRAR